MQELDTLIDKLNTDSYSAISVLDLDTAAFVFRNKPHAEIIADYGSAEEFFETLFADGHRRLTLTLKRKNGSTYKMDGKSFDVNFSKDTQSVEPVKQPVTVHKAELFPNSFGLGSLDMINLFVAKGDAQRLHAENEILKASEKENKKLIEELKEERLATKYDTARSNGTQEMLLGAIQHLPTILATFNGAPPVTGLASPTENYSTPAKQNLAKALQNLDDSTVNVLQSINSAMNTNPEFTNELAELLQKHQLWQA
ncbi:hypothetical protein [Flavobacterium aestivum]|uniref:hypothetical protein n=1 Tax=Flavobacterium aestivum TaxID=3003257 RepID=UPI0022866016|nr:hypothetical protein [Flavobacterium aestivum]